MPTLTVHESSLSKMHMCFHPTFFFFFNSEEKKEKFFFLKLKEREIEVPMKSITRRPSEYRPAGEWKYVSPLGGGACPNAADKPPVSEFESPKLKMAGNSHLVMDMVGLGSSNAIEITRLKIICMV